MLNIYESESRTIENDDREAREERPVSAIARRMVRETELFLSYALTDGGRHRWAMLARDRALAGAR